MTQSADPAVTVCFSVTIDEQPSQLFLGNFTSCDGLGVEVVIEQREEGGNNAYVWQLPTRLKYSNVKLSRPICDDTGTVMAWLASMTTGFQRRTAAITAMSAETKPVATWNLSGVIPVRWTGPSLNLDSPKVAVETLEIAHHGFLPPQKQN
jgi:phage tail-like protein